MPGQKLDEHDRKTAGTVGTDDECLLDVRRLRRACDKHPERFRIDLKACVGLVHVPHDLASIQKDRQVLRQKRSRAVDQLGLGKPHRPVFRDAQRRAAHQQVQPALLDWTRRTLTR